MFNTLSQQIQLLFIDIQNQYITAWYWLLGLWAIHFFNFSLGYRLNYFGILPRHIIGLIGIFTAPFLHGNFNHIFFNSLPIFILMTFILIKGTQVFYSVSVSIILISGLLTWLFGRRSIHIGASALIMGYWGYLFLDAYEKPTIVSILLILILLYYFGISFFASFLPVNKKTSWEGHLFGFIAGLCSSYITFGSIFS